MAILLQEMTGRRPTQSGDGAMCANFDNLATHAMTAERPRGDRPPGIRERTNGRTRCSTI